MRKPEPALVSLAVILLATCTSPRSDAAGLTPSGRLAATGPLTAVVSVSAAPRPWPDTTTGVHVFGDQLSSDLTDAQVAFVAAHYAGVQKLTRTDADRYRAEDPGFLVLHYRLGLGLGYRGIEGSCAPTGPWLLVIEGDDWVVEWPGDDVVQEGWFAHQPPGSGTRVLSCDWGWYLMDLDDPGWRAYWTGEVARQLEANDDDGVFLDSLSVPNYLGAQRYDPPLPELDLAFEAAWTAKIDGWLAWLQTQPLGAAYLVPNVGSWITTRDRTTYASADGLMVEGFAIEADESPYPLEDWRLQMDRILGAVGQGQAILGQSYALGGQERMFGLGSYLLVKGTRTYLTFEGGDEPEWWPEYDVPIGAPIETATTIADLDPDGDGVYVRRFDDGMVLVNPTSPWDGSGVTRTVELDGTFQLVQTSGGGPLPPSGIPEGSIAYTPVTSVTLPPYTAAVVLEAGAAGPRCGGRTATIVGTAGDETLVGTSGADVMAGLGGADVLRGLDGSDRICGGAGDDLLVGGRGADRLLAGAGVDTCRPGQGAGIERSCEVVRRSAL